MMLFQVVCLECGAGQVAKLLEAVKIVALGCPECGSENVELSRPIEAPVCLEMENN